jgi:hypothetical protein
MRYPLLRISSTDEGGYDGWYPWLGGVAFARADAPTAQMTPAGPEPAIPGSVGRWLIHWATGPDGSVAPTWASFLGHPWRLRHASQPGPKEVWL